jgi:tripartite-type tricarboxylate transporter receptor subunit TctC
MIGTVRLVAALALALAAGTALAQAGGKTQRVVVPFPPGGGTDALARGIGARLEAFVEQPVVIENKPGASGLIGAEYVAKSPKDGQTVLFAALIPSARAYNRPWSETTRELAPIVYLARAPFYVVAHPGVPARSLQELVALARAKPGTLNLGSPGSATPQHLAAEVFRATAGLDMVQIPYKGAGPVIADLLGGQIDITFATVAAVEGHVKSGKLRALAVTSGQRWLDSSVPTVAESGFPGYEALVAYAAYAPAGTPSDAIARLNAAFNRTLASPDVAARLKAQGFEAVGGTPAVLESAINEELDRVQRLIKAGKLTIVE